MSEVSGVVTYSFNLSVGEAEQADPWASMASQTALLGGVPGQ